MRGLTQDESGNGLWTVLILRPDYIASDYGQDTYLAHVTAPTVDEAQALAQREAAAADSSPHDGSDYYVLFACRGHLLNLAT